MIVPIVNVDGFKISRDAEPLGDFSTFDYEMKRKNCFISENTPAQYTTGPCDDNEAGRLRGTDLNRNYPASGAAAAPAPTGPATPTAATARAASPSPTRCASSSRSVRSR